MTSCCFFCPSGGSVPAEIGETDGRNSAAATVGLVNGKQRTNI